MMDAVGRPQSVLLVGGTSAIGRSVVKALTGGTGRITLAGRDRGRTMADSTSLGDVCEFTPFDASDPATHDECVAHAWAGGDVDVVVLAHGVLPDNEAAWTDADRGRRVVEINLASAVAVLAAAADRMRAQGHGTIVVLSSVAGQRPRPANFVYGATKAGLDAFATGLRDALRSYGCHVVVVRPGFVHSPMTADRAPAPFATTPEAVGAAVADAVRRRRDVVWVPGVMRWLAAVIRHLPRPVLRRLRD